MSPAELKAVSTEATVTDEPSTTEQPKADKTKSESKVKGESTTEKVEAKSEDTPKVDATEAKAEDAKSAKKKAPAKKAKAQQRPRPTRADRIISQANPKTLLSGYQKTMRLPLHYASDIIHEYLQMNQRTMLSAYERLAAILRMVAKENDLLSHVNEWVHTNTEIAQAQIDTLEATYIEIEEQYLSNNEIELPEVITPDSYQTSFEASHPVAHKMIAIAKKVDAVLQKLESLYFAGIIDDSQYSAMQTQANSIIRGNVDRIFKATTPGVRQGGRFQPSQLARWLREGNKLMFNDVPQDALHLIEEAA